MNIDGKAYRTIWLAKDGWSVEIIDQTRLPHELAIVSLKTVEDAARAIKTMQVRGAPLIGATAAYGVCLALRADASDAALERASRAAGRAAADGHQPALGAGRDAGRRAQRIRADKRVAAAYERAARDLRGRRQGQPAHRRAWAQADPGGGRAQGAKGEPVNILTHCNAGWLACVDRGTALAPIYEAHDRGIALHVWVDETRPRNQGAALTAFELGAHGVPHTIIVDNAGGHLMQQGLVDLCIVGADRVTTSGDAANKIGTYLKALAAKDNGVPFYVAMPHSTIDWALESGADIPIEERSADEVLTMSGRGRDGKVVAVEIARAGSAGAQRCLRRDAGAADYGADHGARRGRSLAGGDHDALSRARPPGGVTARVRGSVLRRSSGPGGCGARSQLASLRMTRHPGSRGRRPRLSGICRALRVCCRSRLTALAPSAPSAWPG